MDDKEREQIRIDAERQEAERRKWLVGVNEEEAIRLNATDKYDRIRYLREALAEQLVTDAKFKPTLHQNRDWKNVYN